MMTADCKIRYTTKTFTLCEVSESDKGKSSAAAGAQPCLDAAQSGIALAVFANSDGVSAGALYMSGGAHGEMRIELEPPYDTPAHVDEMLELAIPFLVRRCGAAGLRCDVSRSPDMIPLLARYGFERVDDQYYARPNVHRFNASRGLAYCGLACCVCGEGEDCAGCRNMGCASYDSCRSFGCCASTGRAGCWQCDEFPCDWDMLGKLRVRTFARYAALRGEQALLDALRRDEARGVLYHYTGKLVGDYDLISDEDALIRFLDGD